jgi:hypothetical protein
MEAKSIPSASPEAGTTTLWSTCRGTGTARGGAWKWLGLCLWSDGRWYFLFTFLFRGMGAVCFAGGVSLVQLRPVTLFLRCCQSWVWGRVEASFRFQSRNLSVWCTGRSEGVSMAASQFEITEEGLCVGTC